MKIRIILLFVFFSIALYGQESGVAQEAFKTSANALLTSAIDEHQFAGVVAGFSVNGEIKWLDAAGMRDVAKSRQMSMNTLVRTASIAKPMTAIAIMQLCEQGKIGLDLPIQIYLPDFPKKKEGDITVRHLINHTAGIAAYKGKESGTDTQYNSLAEAVDVFKDRDLLNEPGMAYNYSTYGYVILGLIIEQVSGLSYEEYMHQHVWSPAGMTRTVIEDRSLVSENRTALYHRNKKGKIISGSVNNLSNRIPGGGLESTAEDLLKFGQAILKHQLVSERSHNTMLESPKTKNRGNPYGFGWTLYGENPKYGDVYGHSGGQTGCSAQLFVLPEFNSVVVVMANTSGAWEDVFRIGIQLFDVAANSTR